MSDPERPIQAWICPKPTDPETELMKLCLDQTITKEDTGHLGIRVDTWKQSLLPACWHVVEFSGRAKACLLSQLSSE